MSFFISSTCLVLYFDLLVLAQQVKMLSACTWKVPYEQVD